MSEHQHSEECIGCAHGAEAMQADHDAKLAEYGWVVHFVTDAASQPPGFVNAHTHGLLENFQHPDLQIVFPMHPEISHGILSRCVELIKEGTKFRAGCLFPGVIQEPYRVNFSEAIEQGRPVLRLLLPDQDHLIEESPNLFFANQATAVIDGEDPTKLPDEQA